MTKSQDMECIHTQRGDQHPRSGGKSAARRPAACGKGLKVACCILLSYDKEQDVLKYWIPSSLSESGMMPHTVMSNNGKGQIPSIYHGALLCTASARFHPCGFG